ncbi:MBL fold metallo-hydrolase [uncultured Tateyamaria sp.]|uniref:MBL fold metallo-hydrolase n=1 Tax=uncultured Tateyamaria sp. TaxID=455651 RepID=UPI0026168A3A|nr:MBL fold metallo-hydrolase [uncultured Tateyamaria sp.]
MLPESHTSPLVSRRSVTFGLGAMALAGLPPQGARSASPNRIRIGDIAVTALSDGHFELPSAAFSPWPKEASTHPLYVGAYAWLIEAGNRRMLVDTGSGNTLRGKHPNTGYLPMALARAGVTPDQVTDIIITHMHADHIGGLMHGEVAAYPNAMLHLCELEWRYWAAPERPQLVAPAQRPLANLIAGLMDRMAYRIAVHRSNGDIGSGVWLEDAPGHTPGHQIVHIASGTQSLLLLGDVLISGTLQFAQPNIRYVLDDDPEQAALTRTGLFDRITADEILFAATHLIDGGPHRLEKTAVSGYRAQKTQTF